MSLDFLRSLLILVMTAVIATGAFLGLRAWTDERVRQAERQQEVRLSSVSQTSRATQYPGAVAWLQDLLRRYCSLQTSSPGAHDDCMDVLIGGDGIPGQMKALAAYLKMQTGDPSTSPRLLREGRTVQDILCVWEYAYNGHRYAVTAPELGRGCSSRTDEFTGFIRWAIGQLDARKAITPMSVPPFGDLNVERAYIAAQDGTLISRRFGDLPASATAPGPDAQGAREDATEGLDYREFINAGEGEPAPSIASVRQLFPLAKPTGFGYSGTYLDLTDFGVVSTAVTILDAPHWGQVTLALDVKIGTSWVSALTAAGEHIAFLDGPRPFTWKLAAESAELDPEARKLAAQCKTSTRDTVETCAPGDDPRGSMIMAIMLGGAGEAGPYSAHRWLIRWVPALGPPFQSLEFLPLRVWEIIPSIGILGTGFICWYLDRRHRYAARQAALMAALDIATVTLDPNDDRVRFASPQARALGLREGETFRSHVHEADRETYDEAHQADIPERIYCVRLMHPRQQWTIVRSTPIQGRIAPIKARVSDRFAVIELLGQDHTARWREEIEDQTKQYERSKLGSLLNHGIASLVHVACGNALDPALSAWLMSYMERRVGVVAELQSGWGASLDEVRQNQALVDKPAVSMTLAQLQRLGAFIAEDRDLRRKLRWQNGVLSRLPCNAKPFHFDLNEWPDDLHLITFIEGAELFILEELLVNAFKYGRPGAPPAVTARCVRRHGRRWIEFEVCNEVQGSCHRFEATHPYGGRELVGEACRRLGWDLLKPEISNDVCSVKVRARSIDFGGGLSS